MVFNATIINISVLSCRSVLLGEETALFCPLSIRLRIKASDCPFGNFILLKNIISYRHPVLDTEEYRVVMQTSRLIWRPSWS